MFIKHTSAKSLEEILSHELIHIQQMENGDLIPLFNGKVIYKDELINLLDVDYDHRKYEIDAFKQEKIIYKQLIKLLYK